MCVSVVVAVVVLLVVGQTQRHPPCNPQPSLHPGDAGGSVEPPLTNCLLLHVCVCASLCACVCCNDRYQDRGLPFCYVGYFDGMEEGVLRANIIEAKVNNVSVR